MTPILQSVVKAQLHLAHKDECIHVHMSHIYTNSKPGQWTIIYIYTYIWYMHTHTHIYIYTYLWYMHIYSIYIYTCIIIYIYIYIYVYTYTYTCTFDPPGFHRQTATSQPQRPPLPHRSSCRLCRHRLCRHRLCRRSHSLDHSLGRLGCKANHLEMLRYWTLVWTAPK